MAERTMDPILLGAIAGGTAALGVLLMQRRGAKTSVDVLPVLRARGSLTIPEIMEALELSGMQAQGKVVFALDSLVRNHKVAEGAVPRGTPQLARIKVRRYTAI